MNVTGRAAALAFVSCAFLIVAMVDCGGKTEAIPQTDSVAGSSGSTGLGGGTSAGGSTSAGGNTSTGGSVGSGGSAGAAVVAPRVPPVHRSEALSCLGVHNPPEPNYLLTSTQCTQHADCADAGVNGKCVDGPNKRGMWFCTSDTCASDADCAPAKVCYCTQYQAASCLAIGNCRTDADCGNGQYSYCSPSASWHCGWHAPTDGYHCHTPSDSCMDNSDCDASSFCNFNVYENRWTCETTNDNCAWG